MSLPYPEKCLLCMRAEETSGRQYAMKRMRKSAVVQCPEHVFCEQAITRNTAHPFCLRQYASFQDKLHLYFLFDLMPGGDLMDVLVAEAKVIKRRISQGAWKRACLAPKVPRSINLRHYLRRLKEQKTAQQISPKVSMFRHAHHPPGTL